jgi:hypothetical protein
MDKVKELKPQKNSLVSEAATTILSGGSRHILKPLSRRTLALAAIKIQTSSSPQSPQKNNKLPK